MGYLKYIISRIRGNNQKSGSTYETYEYCPRCNADLTWQKGYDTEAPYCICKNCGEMLINPNFETDSDIIWRCDGCETLLNIQKGFTEDCGEWKCTECGHVNKIDVSELYLSEDEYQADLSNPYKGLSDEDVLKLSDLSEEDRIAPNVLLVRDTETGERFIEKYLTEYDLSIYEYFKDHPVEHIPRIIDYYEGSNGLVVLEEYIEGETIAEMLSGRALAEKEAIHIAREICVILNKLHSLPTPIIHRDIKPSNVMTSNGEVYLLDVNIAKWYDPDQTDDTKHLGTPDYAAPEQVGFGLKASSPRTDIYAIGQLLNVMITGEKTKAKQANGPIWNIIERCTKLEEKERCSLDELMSELEKTERYVNA